MYSVKDAPHSESVCEYISKKRRLPIRREAQRSSVHGNTIITFQRRGLIGQRSIHIIRTVCLGLRNLPFVDYSISKMKKNKILRQKVSALMDDN
jgi:hypothetical protein